MLRFDAPKKRGRVKYFVNIQPLNYVTNQRAINLLAFFEVDIISPLNLSPTVIQVNFGACCVHT